MCSVSKTMVITQYQDKEENKEIDSVFSKLQMVRNHEHDLTKMNFGLTKLVLIKHLFRRCYLSNITQQQITQKQRPTQL